MITLIKKTIYLLIISCVLISFSSCGLIFGGTKYIAKTELKNPENGAIVYYNEKIADSKLKNNSFLIDRNKDSVNFIVKREGCQTQNFNFTGKDVRIGTLMLTIVSWGLIGLVIDFASGGLSKPLVNNETVFKEDFKTFKYVLNYTGCQEENLKKVKQ